jgi:hypothetical protein
MHYHGIRQKRLRALTINVSPVEFCASALVVWCGINVDCVQNPSHSGMNLVSGGEEK